MKKDPAFLFSIEWVHSYFNNGYSNGLNLIPKADTKRIFDRFGISICQNLNVTSGISMRKTEAGIILKYLNETMTVDSFRFFISTSKQPFLCYTELPDETKFITYNTGELQEGKNNNAQILIPRYSDTGQPPYIGVVELFLTDLISKFNEGKIPTYLIQFVAIQTQWQYYVVNRSSKTLLQLSIEGVHSIEFSGPEKVELPNQLQALKFTSGASKIPLSYTNPWQFKLVNTTLNSVQETVETVIVNGLPSPAVDQISFDENGNAISPMLVYI